MTCLRFLDWQVDIKENRDKDHLINCKDSWSIELQVPEISEDSASATSSLENLKEKATQYLTQGRYTEAIQCYSESIKAAKQESLDDSQVAKLYSNRALAHIKNESYIKASHGDCTVDISFLPSSWQNFPDHYLIEGLLCRLWRMHKRSDSSILLGQSHCTG
jgi:tetratricopeptide (TPR) repeat protein